MVSHAVNMPSNNQLKGKPLNIFRYWIVICMLVVWLVGWMDGWTLQNDDIMHYLSPVLCSSLPLSGRFELTHLKRGHLLPLGNCPPMREVTVHNIMTSLYKSHEVKTISDCIMLARKPFLFLSPAIRFKWLTKTAYLNDNRNSYTIFIYIDQPQH